MQISLSCAVTKQITAVEACHIVSLSGGLAAHQFGFISVALVLVVVWQRTGLVSSRWR